MSGWEVNLGGSWKALIAEQSAFLHGLEAKGCTTGDLKSRGQLYRYDFATMTQTNLVTKKSRAIRYVKEEVFSNTNELMERSNVVEPTSSCAYTDNEDSMIVQVWLSGDWKRLSAEESKEIFRRKSAGFERFEMNSRGLAYQVNLVQMTQTNLATKRTRTIRFASSTSNPAVGFDEFREAFFARCKDKSTLLTTSKLQDTWPDMGLEGGATLVDETVRLVLKHMDLRGTKNVDLTEWIHFWAMERDCPSFHAGEEVNVKLREALKKDKQVLGRMQMHFETACGETGATEEGLSSQGLIKACHRLVASPQDVIEKQWAKEVLQRHEQGEGPEEDAMWCYYDFLNVMLGRKRFPVTLWMYDISDGIAAKWSWLLLGQNFRGIWHTGVVIEWADRASEYWFGGKLFESVPGTTPFGQPVEKKFLGYTYKLREEVWQFMQRQMAPEFTQANYDVLTHNCNHFSDKLSLYIRAEHIPDEVRMQPDMVMNTLTARALRPLLNRWLGGFGDESGRATDDGEAARKMWDEVLPHAVVEFSLQEGGRPLVGMVTDVLSDDCAVVTLDFWRGCTVERSVPRMLVSQILVMAPPESRRSCQEFALGDTSEILDWTRCCRNNGEPRRKSR